MRLLLASNALYPVEIGPLLPKEILVVNPMSHVVDPVRELTITGNTSSLPIEPIVLVLFDVVLFCSFDIFQTNYTVKRNPRLGINPKNSIPKCKGSAKWVDAETKERQRVFHEK